MDGRTRPLHQDNAYNNADQEREQLHWRGRRGCLQSNSILDYVLRGEENVSSSFVSTLHHKVLCSINCPMVMMKEEGTRNRGSSISP
jgi:hypothetical protein